MKASKTLEPSEAEGTMSWKGIAKSSIELLSSPRLLGGIAITCGAVLIAPPNWSKYIAGVQEKYAMYLFLACLLSCSTLLCHAIPFSIGVGTPIFRELRRRHRIRGRLRKLTSKEKEYLKEYLDNDTRTQEIPYMDGVAAGLERCGILYRARDIGRGTSFAYNMNEYVWDYLQAHPELLDLRQTKSHPACPGRK